MLKRPTDLLPIGYLAERTGLSVSAIRFYEEKGLVTPYRNNSGQRRFHRSDIRRLSFVLIAQQLGLTIKDIEKALKTLPDHRTPTKKDWEKISRKFHKVLDDRIEALERTRRNLEGCIGCGCLSLTACRLYNPDDIDAAEGPGPRTLTGRKRRIEDEN